MAAREMLALAVEAERRTYLTPMPKRSIRRVATVMATAQLARTRS
jgi:hypothetical protein